MAEDDASQFTVTVDRTEEGFAVLELEDDFFFELPLSKLPERATDGKRLRVTIELE